MRTPSFLCTLSTLFVLCVAGCGGTVTADPPISSTDTGTTDTASPIDGFVADTVAPPLDARRDLGPDAGADLIVDGENLGPYEGKLIRFVITSRVDLSPISAGSGRIVGGKVSVALPGSMPRDHFGVGLDAFIDLDEDAKCDEPGETTWFTIATNRIGEDVIRFTFDPSKADPITCSKIGK